MDKYVYNDEGAGIAGLPHEITKEEAAALGVSSILDAAIKRGAYRKVKAPRKTQAPRKGEK